MPGKKQQTLNDDNLNYSLGRNSATFKLECPWNNQSDFLLRIIKKKGTSEEQQKKERVR